ncbi:hypothetical protein G7Y79_00013g035840 [Physcia stellaris]|nr:hypothetical protein G7Y79_00013g035840 [Physcia stellaris]
MMSVQPKSLTLPPEVWSRIFSNCEANEKGLTHLWTDCRHVSRACMSEVEALFRSRYLPKVCISFDLGDYYHGGYENGYRVCLIVHFAFNRLASDGNTAIFKDHSCAEDFMPVVSNRLLSYVALYNNGAAINSPKHAFKLKRCVNDTELPELAYDPKERDLSFNWRQALTCFFIEERVKDACVNLRLLTPSSSGMAEVQRVRAAQDNGRMSMEEGFMCLLKHYGGTHHEGQRIARRKRIFRQWKAHGWTEKQVLADEDFEADERAALSTLRDGAQLLDLQQSSDDDDEEEE